MNHAFRLLSMAAILLMLPLSCDSDEESDQFLSLLLLQSASQGPSGTNLARVQFDNLTILVDQPIIHCDVDNSSGAGIEISLSGPIANSSVVITSVPSTSPFTFPQNGALDLRLPASHLPDASGTCVLSRSENTSLRYTASLSGGCQLNGHSIQVLEIDCKPD
ncbi:MAG: hypothetical protein KDK23_08900 [Leptospiraceae bacterium]|nr:hypothetical protein [Leptospiraceae bacterium]